MSGSGGGGQALERAAEQDDVRGDSMGSGRDRASTTSGGAEHVEGSRGGSIEAERAVQAEDRSCGIGEAERGCDAEEPGVGGWPAFAPPDKEGRHVSSVSAKDVLASVDVRDCDLSILDEGEPGVGSWPVLAPPVACGQLYASEAEDVDLPVATARDGQSVDQGVVENGKTGHSAQGSISRSLVKRGELATEHVRSDWSNLVKGDQREDELTTTESIEQVGTTGYCLLSPDSGDANLVPRAELSVGHVANAPASTLEGANQCLSRRSRLEQWQQSNLSTLHEHDEMRGGDFTSMNFHTRADAGLKRFRHGIVQPMRVVRARVDPTRELGAVARLVRGRLND